MMQSRAHGSTRSLSGRVGRPAVRPRQASARTGLPCRQKPARGATVAPRAVDMFVEEETTISTFQTILLFLGGAAGIGAGIAVPSFYSNQTAESEARPNTQPCFVCDGTGETVCRFCDGTGETTMMMGSGELQTAVCVNCSGEGKIVCTTCNGTGIAPRYLDRREFVDDD